MTSNNPAPPRRHRSRNILILIAAVALGLLVGLIVVGQTTATTTPTSTPALANHPPALSSATPTASATPLASTDNSVDGVSGSLADGCLGGTDAFTAILAAQKAATPDNNGAAAFARTVARWSASYPSDPNATAVLNKLQKPGSAFAQFALLQTQKADAALQSQGYVSAQILPNLGQYRMLSGTTGGSTDSAIVQVQLYRELTNTAGQKSQMQLTTELVLQLSSGVWTVVGSPPNQQNPSSAAIPWQSFSGAC